MPVFFNDEDYRAYIALLSERCRKCSVEIWAYCLIQNHVHLIAVPENDDGLRRGELVTVDSADNLLGKLNARD